MLYFTLTISIGHLACVFWFAYSKSSYSIAAQFFAIISSGFLFLLGLVIPLLLMQAIVVVALLILCRAYFSNRPWTLVVSSLLVVGGLYGNTAWETWTLQRNLLERFPMQSMADRVPTPKRGKSIEFVAEANAWSKLEERIGAEIDLDQQTWASRSVSLRKLHEEITETFVNSPGFGVVRMPNPVLRSSAYNNHEPVESIPQPESSRSLFFSTEDLQRSYTGQSASVLRGLHFDAVRDFVNFQGFGYVKDRQHVAGFRPHEFSKMPNANPLRIKRLELVSLLMNDKPMVYVSNSLPRMSERKHSATRTLSDFETKGLLALEAGEDMYIREIEADLHVLGAIRSVKQCVHCHGGERGDLLGAFSYLLRE